MTSSPVANQLDVVDQASLGLLSALIVFPVNKFNFLGAEKTLNQCYCSSFPGGPCYISTAIAAVVAGTVRCKIDCPDSLCATRPKALARMIEESRILLRMGELVCILPVEALYHKQARCKQLNEEFLRIT